MNSTFDPLKFSFKRVNIDPPNYSVYGKDLGDSTKESPDFLRLNIFLSQSENYVTVWAGLFDPHLAEGRLGFKNSHLIDFSEQYYETRFRGNIGDHKTAKVILDSLMLDKYCPSKLELDKEGRLCCNSLR